MTQAGRAESQQSQAPHPLGAGGEQPTNGGTTTLQRFLHSRNKRSEPNSGLPSLGILRQEDARLECLALKASRAYIRPSLRARGRSSNLREARVSPPADPGESPRMLETEAPGGHSHRHGHSLERLPPRGQWCWHTPPWIPSSVSPGPALATA